MATIKVRQPKRSGAQHPKYYSSNTGQHWADKYREENQGGYRKSFIAIVCVMAAIVLILILATVTMAINTNESSVSQITAADTFAISSYEQQQMQDKAQTFAEGILVYAYCSDEDVAEQGKTAALRLMANNTSIYREVQDLERVGSIVSADSIAPVTTTPQLQDATRAYAASFTYEFDGVVADTSVTDDSNPDGTFVDGGYHYTVTFDQVTDDATGESVWVITNATIQAK